MINETYEPKWCHDPFNINHLVRSRLVHRALVVYCHDMSKCAVCGKRLKDRKGLSCHVKVCHHMEFSEYIVLHELQGVRPVCKCGCGRETSFLNGKFMTWVGSHYHVGRPKSTSHRAKIGLKHRGTRHTLAHNAAISAGVLAAHKRDPSLAQRSSTANKGKKVSATTRQQISCTRSAMIALGQIVINASKISDTMTRKLINGEFTWSKGVYIGDDMTQRVPFRSNWEYYRMCELDADPTVIRWKHEFTRIDYVLGGRKRGYVPDFHIEYSDGTHVLEEVKPFELRNTSMNAAKREAAQAWCNQHGWEYAEWPPSESHSVYVSTKSP